MCRGCSSGVLEVNGVHDPVGVPIEYLISGAPWVIGNLWDVTDRDLDRLSITCMEKAFNESDSESGSEVLLHGVRVNSVALSLVASRDVCKQAYAVGCAPVMYGLPICINPRE